MGEATILRRVKQSFQTNSLLFIIYFRPYKFLSGIFLGFKLYFVKQ